MTKYKYDWEQISKAALDYVDKHGLFPSEVAMAKILQVKRQSLQSARYNGDFPEGLVEVKEPKEETEDSPEVSWEEAGNEAHVKFDNAEFMTLDEALEFANVDREIWDVADYKYGFWTTSRRGEEKEITWVDGVKNGYTRDSGEFHRAYNFKTEIKLTRKVRIAVTVPLRPIELTVTPAILPPRKRDMYQPYSLLVTGDQHFGFVDDLPIHHREFIGTLMRIANEECPDEIVLLGDLLDLAGFSTFPTSPSERFKLQKSGMEAAWVISQFRRHTGAGAYLEGNHEVRMGKAVKKNLAEAFELRPVHDQDGERMLSIQRFLGLEKLGYDYYSGYPAEKYTSGDAMFTHHYKAPQGSAKTVAQLMQTATRSHFFGHIHRPEGAWKYVVDSEKEIFVGTPGCACHKDRAPGASQNSNWSLGAFLVHMDRGMVVNVEPIRRAWDGPTYFRGRVVPEFDYMPQYEEEIAQW